MADKPWNVPGTHGGERRATIPPPDGSDRMLVRSFTQLMELSPTAIALTRGPEHTLVCANAAFRRLTDGGGTADIGRPIAVAIRGRETGGLVAVLDRVLHTGVASRENSLAAIASETASGWQYSVWPESSTGGAKHLVVELWESSQTELTLTLQRELAERMLLSSIREREATESAQRSGQRSSFLAAEGRRLAESLDETATRDAVTRLALPSPASWCIVDVFADNGAMRRLRIVHPDPAKQALARELEDRWEPCAGDPFGLPAMLRRAGPIVIGNHVDEALAGAAHDPATLKILHALGIGSLLTVPILIRDSLSGALTFVSEGNIAAEAGENVALAQDLAVRSAMALDAARLHGEALAQRSRADSASKAKSSFLGMMSHELRTPLNAIGGYVDLIDMGVRGPVSEPQHIDLGRIRSNQRRLLALVTDLMNFVRVGSGGIAYKIGDVVACEAIALARASVDSLMLEKGISFDASDCAADVRAHADPEKMEQILINLFSNAIKFTPRGGQITVGCAETASTILISMADTGIGIPSGKLEAIFDPFVQVKEGFAGRDTGAGLGLAISRDLARAMKGDLSVESELGRGSRFTLVLPRAYKG